MSGVLSDGRTPLSRQGAPVLRGVGREAAHEAIKEHAVGVALEMRQGLAVNDLLDMSTSSEPHGSRR